VTDWGELWARARAALAVGASAAALALWHAGAPACAVRTVALLAAALWFYSDD
jgi:hypothetical protein